MTTLKSIAFEELSSKIGQTPLLLLEEFSTPKIKILAKQESFQLGGSIKSRSAYLILKECLEQDKLSNGQTLLAVTGVNTAIALVTFAQKLEFNLEIMLFEEPTKHQRNELRGRNVSFQFWPQFEKAHDEAMNLLNANPKKYHYINPCFNDANWEAHYSTTGLEILEQTWFSITHFVAGMGTTGTFTGIGRRLKESIDSVKLIALQPVTNNCNIPGWRNLQNEIIPCIYDMELADRILYITEEKIRKIKDRTDHYGMKLSPSSMANLAGCMDVSGSIDEGVIVTLFPDQPENYLL